MEGQTAETAPVIECKHGNEKIGTSFWKVQYISCLEVTSSKKPCKFHITQNLANLFYPCNHMFALNSVFNNSYNLQDP